MLGLLFLKYIEDAFDERREELRAAVADADSEYYVAEATREAELTTLLEDRDEYTAENVFWVPTRARWSHIQKQATQPTIGKTLDEAMDAIERENPTLKGVLPKIFALPNLDKHSLGKLINLFSSIGLGTKAQQETDTLGRIYEYFLAKFASAEGKGGGEFYTPTSIVRLLVAMLEPYKGRVYDPCCGSGGMFVQSLKFIDAHNGRRDRITVYGQESNRTTWRMAQMNLAIRGIETNLGRKHADSFHEDLHPDLRADFVLANPPFNVKEWGAERLADDVRWKFGTPPVRNANFAWVQHFVHHLSPKWVAGFVLANGSMTTVLAGEGKIREKLVKDDLIDCIVACPGQLFYATQIPVCLWFLTKNKASTGHRNRRGETLFIDARKIGRMETRVHRVFDPEDIAKVADTYHAWRSQKGSYEDVAGDVPPILSSTSVESPIIRKGRSDVKKRFTEAQIIGFLRETEAGLPVKDLCRRHGFSEASYYLWRSKFGGMSVSDAKRLKELETENGRLKKLLAESQLEIEVTREVLRKKW